MTYTLRVVCRPAVSDGFALAGLRALPAVDAAEGTAILRRLVDRAETGVLLVEDTLYDALPEELRHRLESRSIPVVIPFPTPARQDRPSAESQLAHLLQRAIGYRVRLR